MTRLLPALWWLLVAAMPRGAQGHSFENIYATDARFKAMAGAATAIADGPAAAYFNPAGLSLSPGVRMSLGLDLVSHHVFSRPTPASLESSAPYAVASFGLSAELWPGRVFAGTLFSLAMGSQLGMDRITPNPKPTFALYEDQLEVMTLMAALAARLLDGLSVGLGVSIRGGSHINLMLDISALSQDEVAGGFTYDMRMTAGVAAGLSWDATDKLRLGLVYRSALYHKLSVDNDTIVNMMGVETNFLMLFETVVWYTPQQLSLGAAYQLWDDRLTLSADVSWHDWSGYSGPFIQVRILDSPGGALLKEPAPYEADFSDIFVPRIGAAYQIGSRFVTRAGYAFHPTPAPTPRGETNVLDSHKHVLALGGGVEILNAEKWPMMLRVDLSLALHLFQTRDRGPDLEWGGKLINGGATVTVGL